MREWSSRRTNRAGCSDHFTRRLDPGRETRRLIAKLEALGLGGGQVRRRGLRGRRRA